MLKQAEKEKMKENAGKRKSKKSVEVIDSNTCSTCGKKYSKNSDILWIGCSGCDRWYHVKCSDVEGVETEEDVREMGDWFCDVCL